MTDVESPAERLARHVAANSAWLHENAEVSRVRLKLAADLAVTGLRSLILVNGGAIVALFTVLGQTSSGAKLPIDRAYLFTAFAIFAIGVLLGMAANVLGYWSQQMIAMVEWERSSSLYLAITDRQPEPEVWNEAPNRILNTAVILACGSVGFFIFGSLVALIAVIAGR